MEKYLIKSEPKNMENIKVIFIDIDGTLADDKNIISKENKVYVTYTHKRKNIAFCEIEL